MTISTTSTYGTQPNTNADGNQVWDPQVGIYHKPAAKEAHSYGGILGALEDLMAQNAVVPKAYPHNFAGIIAAIQDLTFSQQTPPVLPGPTPGNGNIIIDIDGNPEWDETYPMPDGSLWFDTRQGRLFVSIDNEWYQTNGADGLPIVTNTSAKPEVEHPIPGQFWWDASQNDLYIFDGIYQLPDGGFTDNPTIPFTTPVWKLVTDGLADAFQTTTTLPLGSLGPKLRDADDDRGGLDFYYITQPEPTDMTVQSDYNVWLFDAFKEIDKALHDKPVVHVDENPPTEPRAGDFWYDTSTLELSIYYQDDDSSQWVPTSVGYMENESIAALASAIEDETRLREQAIHNLFEHIESLTQGEIPDIDTLESKVAMLESQMAAMPEPADLSGYATDSELQAQVNELTYKIDAVNKSVPDTNTLATNSSVITLSSAVAQLPNKEYVLDAISDAQPDLSSYVTQAEIDSSISGITTEYLPRTGGTLTGAFVVQKEDMSEPAFDFSTEKWHSYNTHKYRTNSQATNYSTFGTNTNFWEYAWNFASEEDFCWLHDGDKVFSITKEGPACSHLILGDFLPNDSTNGRQMRNKIDVKQRLETYQLAFEQMRQGVSNATDFASLKSNILSALAIV